MNVTVKSRIRTIPHYPKPGVMFRDITTLLKDSIGFRLVVDDMVQRYHAESIDKVAAIEARGFILGAPLAYQLGRGFIPVRKRGKLPAATVGQDYALEYGTDRIEMHVDAIEPGERVLLVDDLIATGGTAEAAVMLIRKMGGDIVACCFAIELADLGGRQRLEKLGCDVHASCTFEGLQ